MVALQELMSGACSSLRFRGGSLHGKNGGWKLKPLAEMRLKRKFWRRKQPRRTLAGEDDGSRGSRADTEQADVLCGLRYQGTSFKEHSLLDEVSIADAAGSASNHSTAWFHNICYATLWL